MPSSPPKTDVQILKKHVAAVHTSGELTLVQRKLVNILLLNAYDDLLGKREHTIPTSLMATMCGWESGKNVKDLKDAVTGIMSTVIEFNLMGDGKEADGWEKMTMLSYARVANGLCTYSYPEQLAKKLFDPEVFANINLSVQTKFRGGYSLTLYENCLRFKRVGSTGWWDLDTFRRLVGAEAAMYDEFKHLNNYVIKKAVEEINTVSDIFIEANFRKTGRKTTHIQFDIRENPQQDLFRNIGNEIDDVRQSEAYKSLMKHKISDRLALAFISNTSAEQLKDVLEYTEAKASDGKIRSSTGAYIKTLIETGANVSKPMSTGKKRAAAGNSSRLANLEKEYLTAKTRQSIQALTAAERRKLADQFRNGSGKTYAALFNEQKGEFSQATAQIAFMGFLSAQLKPQRINRKAFQTWAVTEKKVDPALFGDDDRVPSDT